MKLSVTFLLILMLLPVIAGGMESGKHTLRDVLKRSKRQNCIYQCNDGSCCHGFGCTDGSYCGFAGR
nr:TPA_inf: conotoxin precursor I1 [Conus ebraeus]